MNKLCQILVVDDDIEDHFILRSYFEEAGFTEGLAFLLNGKQALAFLEQITETDQLPKLVLLDLNMPIKNGTQTLLEMKGSLQLRNIPVIIFSTSENDSEKRKCLSLGAEDYVVKPITYKDGKNLVDRFLSYL